MTGLQIALVIGLSFGLGVWLLIVRLAPVHPNLAQSLDMLSPVLATGEAAPPATGWDRVGAWGLARLPDGLRPIPGKDLAILQLTPTRFLARKLAGFATGLILPGLVSTILVLLGVDLHWSIPALGGLIIAVIAFLLPDLDVRARAVRARRDWAVTLACYVDLVALERSCGSGTTQALEVAAGIGDSAVFRRLRESLDRSNWSGLAAWDGLRDLAETVAVPDLADLADIVRLSATEGAGISRTLRAKARSLREAILTAEITRANEANEKMSLPMSLLGIVFLAILIGPALLTMLGHV